MVVINGCELMVITLWSTKIAIENDPFIVELAIEGGIR
jgi:hypothetical protein